jgi:hypothetical protein
MPDLSIKDRPSIVSPENPTHFCNVVPEPCWTTTYARCGALELTHVLAGVAELVVGVAPHAVMIARASVALAQIMYFRTTVPPGGQPFPYALLKADRQELPCRCARTGCQ